MGFVETIIGQTNGAAFACFLLAYAYSFYSPVFVSAQAIARSWYNLYRLFMFMLIAYISLAMLYMSYNNLWMRANCSPRPELPAMAITVWISAPFIVAQALCIGTIALTLVALVLHGAWFRGIKSLSVILACAYFPVGMYLLAWSIWIDRHIPTSRPGPYTGLFCLTGFFGVVALASLIFVIWRQMRVKPQLATPVVPGVGVSCRASSLQVMIQHIVADEGKRDE
jgi:hypothetical protein